MRIVIQRVNGAKVTVNDSIKDNIDGRDLSGNISSGFDDRDLSGDIRSSADGCDISGDISSSVGGRDISGNISSSVGGRDISGGEMSSDYCDNIGGKTIGEIKNGLLVLVAFGIGDCDMDIEWAVDKIVGLRVFEDTDQKMNLSVKDVGGSLLIVSQFTLYGDIRKGRRPSFTNSMPPDEARKMYEKFVAACTGTGVNVETGEFREYMHVHLVNDGPVTLIFDTEARKKSRRASNT